MKTFEVVVTSVKDVERVIFIRNDIHCFCIVDSCWRYVKECWNLGFQIIQCMHLDTTFPLSEQSPFKGAQAQVNCRRIKGIDVSIQLEDVNDPTSLSFCDDLIGKLLEDAIIALGVGIRKSTLGSVLTKSKVISFGCVRLGCQDNITKTFTVG